KDRQVITYKDRLGEIFQFAGKKPAFDAVMMDTPSSQGGKGIPFFILACKKLTNLQDLQTILDKAQLPDDHKRKLLKEGFQECLKVPIDKETATRIFRLVNVNLLDEAQDFLKLVQENSFRKELEQLPPE